MPQVYLHDVPLVEARTCFEKALKAAGNWDYLKTEKIALDEHAVGRVLSDALWAILSSPHYHASAMDGYAVSAKLTEGAAPGFPVVLSVGTQVDYVDTGDLLPNWANSVIPIEQVEPLDVSGNVVSGERHPAAIRIRAAFAPWSHVRPMGEDMVATQLVLPAGQVLRPVDLGAVAACGHTSLRVKARPRVAILPTGTELVSVGAEIKPGSIIEFNSMVLAGQVNQWGGEAVRFSATPDVFEQICQQLQRAADQYDLVLINAGSSAGSEDFTAQAVEHLGQLLVHGVAVRPGHPVILGLINQSDGKGKTPVIGIPGYPVSAALTGEIFVEPLLSHWLGCAPASPLEVEAIMTRKITSPAGDDDFVRVVVGRVNDKLLAAPLSRGAGVITSLVRADGLTVLPSGVQGVEAGSVVKVRLYRKPEELEKTIFAIGSHDLTLDLLSQFLATSQIRLVSANVGSQGGLVALRRGEAHLAGSHLLNPDTGIYNLSYIEQYLPGRPVMVMNWVGRVQGLLVKKGNPQQIQSLQDLTRPDLTFINRQRGSGTRVLLDYHLEKNKIENVRIMGYDQEEYTHLSIAAAVASGRADCGLGIKAAANALDLDFIPLFQEQYDLVIPGEFARSDLLKPLFDLTVNPRFRKAVSEMPGYDISQMGRIILNIE